MIDQARQIGANHDHLPPGQLPARPVPEHAPRSTTRPTAPSRDDFVFAQLIHEGDWDPDPSAVHNLLKYARDNSTLDVKFKRENVQLKDPKAATYPLLYMTGHHEFPGRDEEAAWLQRYLKAGGMLLADACCGRLAFDLAFRREIAKVLPEQQARDAARWTIRSTTATTTSSRWSTRRGSREDFGAAERPGAGGHHARRPAGGGLQPVRPGQRLGAVPPPLQLRLQRQGRPGHRHQRDRLGRDALMDRPSMPGCVVRAAHAPTVERRSTPAIRKRQPCRPRQKL